MLKTLAATALIGLTGLYWNASETDEPQLQFLLMVDGKAHEVQLDQPLQIEGEFKNPSILLKAASTRVFPYGGIEFHYPASFGWEAEIGGANERTWTLSGNDFTLMYFVMPVELTSEDFLMAMAQGFEGVDPDIRERTRTLGGTSYDGHSMAVEFSGIPMGFEVISIPSKSGSRLLVLQDSPDQGIKQSPEAKKALELMTRTFIDHQAPDGFDK